MVVLMVVLLVTTRESLSAAEMAVYLGFQWAVWWGQLTVAETVVHWVYTKGILLVELKVGTKDILWAGLSVE
jgi:hypothetical protein